MSENSNRRIKILGAGWLGLGCISLAFVFITLFPLTQGKASSETEVSDGYWVLIVMGLVMGTIGWLADWRSCVDTGKRAPF